MSGIVLFITVILTFLIQVSVVPYFAIGDIVPNLLVILCVSMGLMRGRKQGLWTGLITGIFCDLFFGSIFGLYALIYMYVGYLSGYAYSVFFDNDVKVAMTLTAIMDFFYNLAVYGLQFLLRGRTGFSLYLTKIIIPELFYTVLLTFFIHRIYHFINRKFMKPVTKERGSVWVIK